MNKHYSISERANVQILSFTSLTNEWENRQLLNILQEQINAGVHQFVADLSELKLINCVGINFLLSLLAKIQEVGGQLILTNVGEFVARLLAITNLTSVFELQVSLEAAIDQLTEESIFA